MINTAPQALNNVYSREKQFYYNNINFLHHLRHCGVVVKKFLAGADVPGSTPGDAFFFNTMGAFHLGKKPGNFGGSESGISDW